MKNTPKIITDNIKQHLEKMIVAANSRAEKVASWERAGLVMLVGSEGSAVRDFQRAHPQLAGQTIMVIEWRGQDSYSADTMSMGPAVSLLPPREGKPIHQIVVTVEDARALIAA